MRDMIKKQLNNVKLNRYFLILLGLLVIQTGCAPLLITGGTAGGYKILTDKRTMGQLVDDNSISSKLKLKLINNKEIGASGIDVDVLEGTVYLTGYVVHEKMIWLAEKDALSVRGVKGIQNGLLVGRKKMSESMSDIWLELKIKARLLAEPYIRTFNIDVDAVKGVVHLIGIVENDSQKKRVVEIAGKTAGTKRIVDYLETGPAEK
jgi:osmotically-inducible protein OsmY